MNWGLLKGFGEGMSRTAEALERDSRANDLKKQQEIQNTFNERRLNVEIEAARAMEKRHLEAARKVHINPVTKEQEVAEIGKASPGMLSIDAIQALSAAKTMETQGKIEVIDPKTGASKFVDSGAIPEGWVTKTGADLLQTKEANRLAGERAVEMVDAINPTTGEYGRFNSKSVPKGFIEIKSMADMNKGIGEQKDSDLSKLMSDISETFQLKGKDGKGKTPIEIGKEYDGSPPSNITGQSIGILNKRLEKAGQPMFKLETRSEKGLLGGDNKKWKVVQVQPETAAEVVKPESESKPEPTADKTKAGLTPSQVKEGVTMAKDKLSKITDPDQKKAFLDMLQKRYPDVAAGLNEKEPDTPELPNAGWQGI